MALMYLVTGYGSIGSLVVEQLKECDILIVDKNEEAIHKALTNFKDLPNIKFIVADISVQSDVSRIFTQYPIDVVIHTAAMKHVTFCESNPTLATINNVIGINNLLEQSKRANVKKFINISTDKSAYPSNVMGATKFIAERNVLLYDSMGDASYQNIRLGNVLFSNGSLLPTISNIVKNNQTLDLTDLGATRFFIKPDETAKFIADVVLNDYPGQVVIKKLKSATLETMVNATLELIGEKDYDNIRVMGLRQGEKLHEYLYSSAETIHIEDYGDFWSVDYGRNLEPVEVIDSSQFCVSQSEFLSILKDIC